jgi:hypothetical protein
MKIIKHLKEVLSETEMQMLEDGIKALVESEVKEKVDSHIAMLDEKAEEYCALEVEKCSAEIKVKLEEEYQEKIEQLEENITDQLDSFISSEISSQISESVIESAAKAELFSPIVEGVISLFSKNYTPLDTTGEKTLGDKDKKIAELTESVDKLIADKMELTELASIAASKLLIAEKTEGLTESKKNLVTTLLEGMDFDETEKKIGSIVKMVSESEENEEEEEEEEKDSEKNFSDEDGIDDDEEEKIEEEEEEEEEKNEEEEEDDKKKNLKESFSNFISSAEKFI